jgi:alkylation response protein AidB-like acyl-CoA dehydrogenase
LPDTWSLPSYPAPGLREYGERARRFVEEHCVPLEVKAERAHGHLPAEDVARVKQAAIAARLNGGRHEPEHGGQGWTAQQYVAVHEQLGRNTNGVWWWIPDAYNVLRNGTQAQIERYLVPSLRGEAALSYAVTEEFAGSDPASIATRADAADGDSWLLNGEKWFVTSGDVAVAHLVVADTAAGTTIFIVPDDAPGVRTVDNPPFMHSFPHGHPAIRFSDVRLGPEAVIGGVGQGDRLQNEWFTEERLGIAVHCVGAMTRLLEEAVAWATGREQGGSRIYDYQGVSFPLAESAADLTAARLLVWEVARLMDEGADPKVVHAKASVAKLFASEAANRCADRVLQVFGGRGYIRDFAAERFFRELRVDRIWEGTSEIQKLIIARSLERRGVPQVIG